jgi:hypothetical protein
VTVSAMTQDRKTIMAAWFPRLEPWPVSGQGPHRHDLRTMNSNPTVLPVLCDEICDGLGCELSRDSTDERQRDRVRATGRPISRFRTISGPVRTALRREAPQVQECYADRPSPRPNCSWADEMVAPQFRTTARTKGRGQSKGTADSLRHAAPRRVA